MGNHSVDEGADIPGLQYFGADQDILLVALDFGLEQVEEIGRARLRETAALRAEIGQDKIVMAAKIVRAAATRLRKIDYGVIVIYQQPLYRGCCGLPRTYMHIQFSGQAATFTRRSPGIRPMYIVS
jgi:hypothetical protein